MKRLIVSACFFPGVVLLLLAGCAGGPATPKPGDRVEIPTTVVTRLDAGRTGFEIVDQLPLDANIQAFFQRGVDAMAKGDYDTAVESFTTVTRKVPKLSAAHVNLAIAYTRSDRDGMAEPILHEALRLVPGHPLASHEYGLLLRRAGRFGEAREIYEEALQHYPEYYPLRQNLGVLCDLYLDDADCAEEQLALYLKAQPDDEQVKLWLAELQGRAGR